MIKKKFEEENLFNINLRINTCRTEKKEDSKRKEKKGRSNQRKERDKRKNLITETNCIC